MLRGFLLIAQPPLLGEEGKRRSFIIWATAPSGRGFGYKERTSR